MNQIREETSKDPVLAVLHKVVLSGWPSERKEVPEQIRVYWDLIDKITLYDGILYKSRQFIVSVGEAIWLVSSIESPSCFRT